MPCNDNSGPSVKNVFRTVDSGLLAQSDNFRTFDDRQEGNGEGGRPEFGSQFFTPTKPLMKGHMKTTKPTKRHSKLLLKLRSWANYIDEAYQLESMLAKKPAHLHIEFVGSGEIPPDSALLMR